MATAPSVTRKEAITAPDVSTVGANVIGRLPLGGLNVGGHQIGHTAQPGCTRCRHVTQIS